MKTINKNRKSIVSTILLLTLLFATFMLGGSLFSVLAPTQTGYLEEGVYPSSATYTLWVSGATYYAKDGYGHIPTWGISSNATYIMQSAIDAIEEPRGGTIFFKSGTYQSVQGVHINNSIIRLIGEMQGFHDGKGVLFINNSTSGQATILTNGSHVQQFLEFRNLGFRGEYASGTDSGDFIDLLNVGNSVIANCMFTRGNASAIHIDRCYFNRFENLAISYFDTGISITDDLNGWTSNNNYFSNIEISLVTTTNIDVVGASSLNFQDITLQSGDGTYGIRFIPPDNPSWAIHNIIINNLVITDSPRPTYGVSLWGNATQPIDSVTIISSAFQSGSRGIDAQNTHNITIIGCFFDSNTDSSIRVNDNCSEWSIYNSVSEDTTFLAGSSVANVRVLGAGYQNSGAESTVSNGDWITHGLIATPTTVVLTARSSVTVWVNDRNATHFQVGISAGTPDIDWIADYQP